MPYDTRANETMVVSRMSIARIVDINWTGLGSKRTARRYKDDPRRIPALDHGAREVDCRCAVGGESLAGSIT